MRAKILCLVLSFLFCSKNLYADMLYSETENFSHIEGSYIPSTHKPKVTTYTTTKTTVRRAANQKKYTAPAPSFIGNVREKVIIIDPRAHRWAAYSAEGKLMRSGLATTGARWCDDLGRPCKTSSGTFRIYSLGDSSCVSKKFPLGEGGAPMPYCMYFNGGQGLHGSYELARAHLSHGCVRISVNDARWLRYKFATVGTKVVVKSY